MSRQLLIGVVIIAVVVGTSAGLGLAFDPPLEPIHEYEQHESNLEDIVYDSEHDIVWSIDGNLEEDVTFVGYDVGNGEVIESETFENGHALAVGPGVIYIAAADALWTYNVSSGEFVESATLPAHPAELEYDHERGWLWAGGSDLVYAIDPTDGTETFRHEVHEHEIGAIALGDGYVASGATWEDEVIVYDIEADEVAYEPELPGEDDGVGVGALHINDANQLIAGAGEQIPVFDIDSQEQLMQFEGHLFGTSDVHYYEEHDVLISTGADNRVQFIDTAEETMIDEYGHDDTIYVADLDTTNELLWIGDGEGDNPGTVTGLDLSFEAADDATDDSEGDDTDGTDDDSTPDDGETDDSGDETGDDTTTDDSDEGEGDQGDTTDDTGDEATDADGSGDDDSTDDGDDGSPGFGLVAAMIALLGAAAVRTFAR